jgi:hypothetical protein
MAIRNDFDDYDWALPRDARQPQRGPQGLHDYDSPTPVFKDTLIELLSTLVGIVGVFILIIALVKIFAV